MYEEAKIQRTPEELAQLLSQAPATCLVPELLEIARNPLPARELPGARLVAETLAPFLADAAHIPHLPYTLYREFQRTGERRGYQTPYQEKRAKMVALAVQLLLGDTSRRELLQDYLWSTCEETNWVIPAHETREIDLTSAATGFSLAEIIVGLGEQLSDEVVARVRAEIERRIFEPYLARHDSLNWFHGHNNWNGVCNSAVAATFLHLEQDTGRLARALSLALEGLEVFLATAFEYEGSSTEGTSYWQYGLSNLIAFSEMLRLRTAGAIDLLALPRLKDIAHYPTRTMLSVGRYANFADCEEVVAFNPGLFGRMAERTGVPALKEVLAEGAPLLRETNWGRFHKMWRALAWWDGQRPQAITIGDTWARDVGLVRLAATLPNGAPVVLAAKAGHNAENHNHNDVGSFILHVDGESLLCEPGRGLYSRDYFSPRRYENIFASSFGHSVPVVAGQLQAPGREREGHITGFASGRRRFVKIDMLKAYDFPDAETIEREISLDWAAGTITIEDSFLFDKTSQPIEEAFVTWQEVTVEGATARILGERHVLELEITSPRAAEFGLSVLSAESEANAKPAALKRLTIAAPPHKITRFTIVGRILPRQ